MGELEGLSLGGVRPELSNRRQPSSQGPDYVDEVLNQKQKATSAVNGEPHESTTSALAPKACSTSIHHCSLQSVLIMGLCRAACMRDHAMAE